MFRRSKSKRREMRKITLRLKTIPTKGLLTKMEQSKTLPITSPRIKHSHRTSLKTLQIRPSTILQFLSKMRPRFKKTRLKLTIKMKLKIAMCPIKVIIQSKTKLSKIRHKKLTTQRKIKHKKLIKLLTPMLKRMIQM